MCSWRDYGYINDERIDMTIRKWDMGYGVWIETGLDECHQVGVCNSVKLLQIRARSPISKSER